MAEFRFADQCLIEISEIWAACSPGDAELLETALARIATDPESPGRFPTFYDPAAPSFLYRTDPFMIHFRVDESGAAEFLNVFWRRV